MAKKYVGCTIKELPENEKHAAGLFAIATNPANRPAMHGLAKVGFNVNERLAIAVMTTKYFGSGGVNLSVGFLDQASAALQEKIVSHMNAWSAFANVKFTIASGPSSRAQVRITLRGQGYWSYLGTDVLQIPSNQPTMCLQGFSLNTPESEYRRVVRHETGHCLVGDTLIDCPRDLEKYPLGIPIKDMVGQQPWVYAWKDGRITVRKASRVWQSKQNVPIVRVTMRPGRGHFSKHYLPPLELVGTPDHPVLLADGKTWKNLGDLEAGDRLCSLYRSKNHERSRVRWTCGPERIMEHVFVCQEVYGERPLNHDAHHKNGIKMDQSPGNLEWKDEFLHHSEHGRGISNETRQKMAASQTGRKATEETRAKLSSVRKGVQLNLTDEDRSRLSEKAREQFAGKPQPPELIEKRRQAMLSFYANGGRSGMYGKKASEETRVKHREAWKRRKGAAATNHVVVSVESAGFADVYDMTVPDADSFVANGVVVHNSLGCPHEHMRQQIVARLDPNKTIAYFQRTQGWSADEVRQQVLTAVEERQLMATPSAEADSIMCYGLPASITVDGRPIPGGTDITANDGAFIGTLYPLAIQPPTPPPQPTSGKLRVSFDLDPKTKTLSNPIIQ